MKEINEKDIEQAAGGGRIPSLQEIFGEKSAANYRAKGYTLITDQEKGMTCEDFFSYGQTGKGWCGTCQWRVESLDTFESFCTKGY